MLIGERRLSCLPGSQTPATEERTSTQAVESKRKKIHGAVASAAERCGICEKDSLAGLQILAGTPPRAWAFPECFDSTAAEARSHSVVCRQGTDWHVRPLPLPPPPFPTVLRIEVQTSCRQHLHAQMADGFADIDSTLRRLGVDVFVKNIARSFSPGIQAAGTRRRTTDPRWVGYILR